MAIPEKPEGMYIDVNKRSLVFVNVPEGIDGVNIYKNDVFLFMLLGTQNEAYIPDIMLSSDTYSASYVNSDGESPLAVASSDIIEPMVFDSGDSLLENGTVLLPRIGEYTVGGLTATVSSTDPLYASPYPGVTVLGQTGYVYTSTNLDITISGNSYADILVMASAGVISKVVIGDNVVEVGGGEEVSFHSVRVLVDSTANIKLVAGTDGYIGVCAVIEADNAKGTPLTTVEISDELDFFTIGIPNGNSVDLKSGATPEIMVTSVVPYTVSVDVSYVGDNPAVATVTPEGIITPVSIGTVLITGTDAETGKVATATISIAKTNIVVNSSNITSVFSGEHGRGTVSHTYNGSDKVTLTVTNEDNLSNGDTVLYTLTPDDGYLVNGLESDTISKVVSGLEVIDRVLSSFDVSLPNGRTTLNETEGSLSDPLVISNILPVTAEYDIVYLSSDTNLATITNDGYVTVVSDGEVTFTATDTMFGFSKELVVTINRAEDAVATQFGVGITDQGANIPFDPSAVYTLYTKDKSPELATMFLVYSSSAPSVMTVDSSGNLKTISEGVVTITATDTRSEIQRSITVSVAKTNIVLGNEDYSVTFSGENGAGVITITGIDNENVTVTTNASENLANGQIIVMTITPADNYKVNGVDIFTRSFEVEGLTVDGNALVSYISGGKVTFIRPEGKTGDFDYGDGVSGQDTNYEYGFHGTYDIALDDLEETVTVLSKPIPIPGISTSVGDVNSNVLDVVITGGTFVTSTFDGEVYEGNSFQHTVDSAGDYPLVSVIKDSYGNVAKINKVLTLQMPNYAPVVNPTASKYLLVVNYDAGATDSVGETLTYAWTFGDNTTSTSAKPVKTYATAGVYTSTVTVTDNRGKSTTKTIDVEVFDSVQYGPELIPDSGFDGPTLNAGWAMLNTSAAIETVDGKSTAYVKAIAGSQASMRLNVTGMTVGAWYSIDFSMKANGFIKYASDKCRVSVYQGTTWVIGSSTGSIVNGTEFERRTLRFQSLSTTAAIQVWPVRAAETIDGVYYPGGELWIDFLSLKKEI
jgi:PKD repeat protein